MLSIDEGGEATSTLRVGDNMLTERGFTRRFGALDIVDTDTRYATDAEGQIERDRAGGNTFDLNSGRIAQFHDRAFTETTLDLCQSQVDGLFTVAQGR